MAKLEHYDYRAITAGLLLSLIAIAMALGAPSTVFECHRAQGVCELRHGGIVGEKQQRRFALSSVEHVRKVCHRASPSAACAYAVDLRVGGKAETLLSGVGEESEALRFEGTIGAFLANQGQDTLRIEKGAERGYALGVLAFSLVLVGLGVRKNLKDKGLA